MSLAALGSWIELAKQTGNIDQGDVLEGVFTDRFIFTILCPSYTGSLFKGDSIE